MSWNAFIHLEKTHCCIISASQSLLLTVNQVSGSASALLSIVIFYTSLSSVLSDFDVDQTAFTWQLNFLLLLVEVVALVSPCIQEA